MNDIYAMRRANGDVFAFDHHGRFRVPLFHSSRDAMIARSRNWEMLLFKPTLLDAGLLKELVPIGGEGEVDFWLVNDPLVSQKRGRLVEHAQLALLMQNPIELLLVPRNGNGVDILIPGTIPKSGTSAVENWEDEGGTYSEGAEVAGKRRRVSVSMMKGLRARLIDS